MQLLTLPLCCLQQSILACCPCLQWALEAASFPAALACRGTIALMEALTVALAWDRATVAASFSQSQTLSGGREPKDATTDPSWPA